MDKIGELEIRVSGKVGNRELKPDTYDIKHLAALLQDVEALLYPEGKKDRPIITYDVAEGSVRHIFKTAIQSLIGFSAILTQVQAAGSIDFLEKKTARALANIQEQARKKDYTFELKTSLQDEPELRIGPDTSFYPEEGTWVEAEFYFYGVLKNAGGKSKANIHLDTEEYGYLTIATGEDFLKEQEENFLYRPMGVRARGKQHSVTGDVDTRSLRLVEFVDYHPKFDPSYLNILISKAKAKWVGIDPDDWLFQLRGGYEA